MSIHTNYHDNIDKAARAIATVIILAVYMASFTVCIVLTLIKWPLKFLLWLVTEVWEWASMVTVYTAKELNSRLNL